LSKGGFLLAHVIIGSVGPADQNTSMQRGLLVQSCARSFNTVPG
jgi:hypothetical protein